MTPAEIRTFVAEQQVPEGWDLVARVVRQYAHRNCWAIVARRHGKEVRGWRAYNVRELMPHVLAFIEAESQPVTVAVDGDGWVRSLEGQA